MYAFFAQLRLYYTISMEMGQSDGLPDSMGSKGSEEKVLKMDRLAAGGFLGLTAHRAEGCGGGFAADYKKGARLAPLDTPSV